MGYNESRLSRVWHHVGVRAWLGRLIEVDYSDPDAARRAQTLNAFLVATIPVALLAAVIVFPYESGPVSAAFLVAAAAAFVGLLGLTHKGHLRASTWLFALVLGLVTVGQPLSTGDLSTNPLLIPLCTVMLAYVFPLRQGYVVALWVITMLVLLQVGTNDEATVALPRFLWLLNAALATLLTVVVVTYAAHQHAQAERREDALANQLSARDVVLHRLEELANSDPLTGFLNRRSLQQAFQDDHSHAAGDALLVDFSGLVAACAHRNDLLFRLGGDEFLVVRPAAAATDLGMWLHSLREQAQGRDWRELPTDTRVSFSAGVVNRSGAEMAAALRRADRALYVAKEQGRDSIVVVD
jgi:diguanylate cyclase (GGDEF)-like protein